MMKSVRAGNTVYLAMTNAHKRDPFSGYAHKIRVMGNKYPEPKEGYVIDSAPAWFINDVLNKDEYTAKYLFNSRRACERYLKLNGVTVE